MGNAVKRFFDGIVEQLVDVLAGAVKNAATVNLLQNPAASIQLTYELLAGTPAGPGGIPPAQHGLKEKWNLAKADRTVARNTYQSALRAGQVVAMTVVAAFKNVFSRQWSTQWNVLGFTNGSLRVPKNSHALLIQMANYLALHPEYEVAGVNGVDCTAAGCLAAAQAIADAQTDYNAAKGAAVLAQNELAVGLNAGRNRLIGVRTELSQLLADDDARWLDYGFLMPAFMSAPDVPENLTATAADPGSVRAACDETDRADSYRFVFRNPALPAEENVLVDQIVWENQFTATGLVSGSTVTVEVSARNITGESQFTAPVSVVVP